MRTDLLTDETLAPRLAGESVLESGRISRAPFSRVSSSLQSMRANWAARSCAGSAPSPVDGGGGESVQRVTRLLRRWTPVVGVKGALGSCVRVSGLP